MGKMKKAGIWEQPPMLILIVIITVVLIVFIWLWLGEWGGGQVKNITGGLDVSRYI